VALAGGGGVVAGGGFPSTQFVHSDKRDGLGVGWNEGDSLRGIERVSTWLGVFVVGRSRR